MNRRSIEVDASSSDNRSSVGHRYLSMKLGFSLDQNYNEAGDASMEEEERLNTQVPTPIQTIAIECRVQAVGQPVVVLLCAKKHVLSTLVGMVTRELTYTSSRVNQNKNTPDLSPRRPLSKLLRFQ